MILRVIINCVGYENGTVLIVKCSYLLEIHSEVFMDGMI